MRVAVITAMAEEMMQLIDGLGSIVAEDVISGVKVRQIETGEHTVYLATSDIGEIRAALAVQMLADLFDVETVINFGFVGAVNASYKIGQMVLAKRVTPYQFDVSAADGTRPGQMNGKEDIYLYMDAHLIDKVLKQVDPTLKTVTVASGDKFIAESDDKRMLKENFGADVCEMELAGLAIACERNNIPLLSLKVISDNADEGAGETFEETLAKKVTAYSETVFAIVKSLSSEPKPLPPAAL